jgi:hypothetical protein
MRILNERTQIMTRLISTHLVIIPALILSSLFVKSDAYLFTSITQSLIVMIFLTGYWEFFGLRMRMIYSVFMEIMLLASLAWKISSDLSTGVHPLLLAFLSLLQGYFLLELIRMFLVIYKNDKNRYEIAFPFRHGKYLITDGGNSKMSRMMNYHFYSSLHKKNKTNYSMLFATDIVRIDNSGQMFLPLHNEDYPVFGEKVFSPVRGVIFRIENSIKDNIPYSGNYPYNTGNTIVIRNDTRYMLLGHLKMGSIRVNVGDEVSESDWLAEAGNSGYSERPHIHMQLIECDSENFWKGMGIPIQYKGKNLFKNRVIELK